MRDPYEVLGVSRGASDDEIKRAYRAASRRYHPDANLDNPKAAEEKFKEVQQAYKEIVRQRSAGDTGTHGGQGNPYGSGTYGGGQGNPYGSGQHRQEGASGSGQGGPYGDWDFGGWDFGGFGSFGSFGQQQQQMKAQEQPDDSPQIRAVINYINGGYYKEALGLLSGITPRGARWYYLSALANNGAGNNVLAKQQIAQAVSMEPGNRIYQQARQQMEGGGAWYQQRSSTYERPNFGGGDFCMRLCLLNIFCNCCCGGGCCGSPYRFY